PPIRRYVLTK
nr:Chain r, B14.5a [Arabidopsis thaliana]